MISQFIHTNKKKVLSATSVLVLVLFYACVKPYDFDAGSFDKILVVDGTLTNEAGPYKVKITYTYPLDTTLNEFVSDALVWVETSNGNRIDYNWSEEGTYISPPDFQGQVGESYRLFIQMADGTTYSSTEEPMIQSPGIDRIYGKLAELPTSEGDRNTTGIQFFIDSENTGGSAGYFRYEWEEGYQIITPYGSIYDLAPDSSIIPRDTNIGICYSENFSNELIYGTTIGSQENRMVEFPVRFVSSETQILRIRYSILVRQFAITESAYLFYKRLNENNESGGSLFDQQTGSIFGNVSPVDNPDQPVLGFFEVSGVAEKRTFFNNSDFDDLGFIRFNYSCLQASAIETTTDSATYYVNSGYKIYGYDPFFNEVYLHSRPCTDCSYYADTTPPEYWID